MAVDPRVAYVEGMARAALRVDSLAPVIPAITAFVGEYNIDSLHLYRSKTGVSTQMSPGAVAIHFVKRHPGGDVPVDDIQQHILCTMLTGAEGLKIGLDYVFNDVELVDEGAVIALSRSLEGIAGDGAIVATVDAECRFWRQQQSARADRILSHLDVLNDRISGTWSTEDDVVANLEEAQLILGDIWRDDGDYPQSRMANLILCISKRIAAHVHHELSEGAFHLWRAPWQATRQRLLVCSRIVDLWLMIGHDLCQHDFADRWLGGIVSGRSASPTNLALLTESSQIDDHILHNVSTRLRHIREARTLHDELRRLLSEDDRRRFALDSILDPLEAANALHWSSFAEASWKAALSTFDRLSTPIEHHADGILRQRLAAMASIPTRLLAELEEFPELLSRPVAAEELAGERQMLLAKMIGHVQSLRALYEAGPRSDLTFQNMSEVVGRIVWAIQLAARLRQLLDIVGRVLYEVAGLDQYVADDGHAIVGLRSSSG